jgi:hypothetical protein
MWGFGGNSVSDMNAFHGINKVFKFTEGLRFKGKTDTHFKLDVV